MELVVDPEKRGQGRGSKLLKELFENEDILGFSVAYGEAVIFRKNVASQRAFENAGFRYHHTHPDGDDLIFAYKQNLER
jgi:L-amino acid N-acyltransferase YncA